MSLITPDFGLLFWMAVVFFIVLGILWKFGFPVIVKMVNDRKDYIDSSLRNAHEANERLANIKLECESILQGAREKQAQIIKDAGTTRDAIVEKAQYKAREEANRIIAEAQVEIDNQKHAASSEIRKQVVELSVSVAEKILKKELSDKDKQMDLIDRLLEEVSSKK